MSNEEGVMTMEIQDRKRKLFAQAAGVFALAICFAAVPVLVAQQQQQRPDRQDQQYPQEQQEQAEQQEQQEPPEQQQQQDPRNVPFRPFGQRSNARPAPQSFRPAPPTLTIPAGTVIRVRTSQWLSSDHNHEGDLFDAVLMQPVVVDGFVVARPGQTVIGRVGAAQKAKAGGGNSRLGVELNQLILVDGQQLPLRTQLMQSTGRSNTGQNIATMGVTTGLGAAIGATADRREPGEGAGIGAAIGAAAGMIGVLLTPGKPTVIPAEAQLMFQLQSPVTISTERSSQAFQPVGPQDFGTQDYDAYGNGPRTRQGQVPPPPGAYPPPYYRNYYEGGYGYYPSWGYYPGPFFGYYGYYGVGPRFGIRFGGSGRGRSRR
jgi:hypothetical protein